MDTETVIRYLRYISNIYQFCFPNPIHFTETIRPNQSFITCLSSLTVSLLIDPNNNIYLLLIDPYKKEIEVIAPKLDIDNEIISLMKMYWSQFTFYGSQMYLIDNKNIDVIDTAHPNIISIISALFYLKLRLQYQHLSRNLVIKMFNLSKFDIKDYVKLILVISHLPSPQHSANYRQVTEMPIETKQVIPEMKPKKGIVLCHGRAHSQVRYPDWIDSRNIKWTLIDVDPKTKPDIVGNVTSLEFIKSLGIYQYDYVINAHCPSYVGLDRFRSSARVGKWLLKAGGSMIFLDLGSIEELKGSLFSPEILQKIALEEGYSKISLIGEDVTFTV